ncbi:MAG: hypothetical protein K2W95_12100 [Candidatus Obscuribacterales bacterium]|nr:hypothetical protein [Candidatus Obscuribacterales bacterium]
MRSKEESLAEFRRTFGSKQAFLRMLWEREGDTCFCGSKKFVYSENLRSRYCERKHRRSVTASTFFHHSKALMALAMALWLAADGILVSGSELARLNNIEESSAWENLKKVSFLALHLLKIGVKAPSEVFSFILGRRTIETPRQQHPRAELLTRPNTDDCDVESVLQQVAIGKTVEAIIEVHQRVSRKYLQLFAATMVFVHEELNFTDLLLGCLAVGPIRRVDIMAYVSPPNIELMPVPGD